MEKSIYSKDYQTLLRELRRAREASGLTQGQLAKRLGCTQSFISKCERGEPRLENVGSDNSKWCRTSPHANTDDRAAAFNRVRCYAARMNNEGAKTPEATIKRAYYHAAISTFRSQRDAEIIGALTKESQFAIEPTQRDAWVEQIHVMRQALANGIEEGLIAFEYTVPRVGRRIDVLVVLRQAIVVIEFKVGDRHFSADATNQVWDYALDLKNFHSTSHQQFIVPVLVATQACPSKTPIGLEVDHDDVFRPIHSTPGQLASLLSRIASTCDGRSIDLEEWSQGRYMPTPTIIDAAMALYGGHRVDEISRSDATAINLSQTSDALTSIIHEAKSKGRKSICFVTGVPGAGKTLVGLNIATQHIDKASELYSVFLSGNAPLVSVLCEALARDKARRSRLLGEQAKLGSIRSEVKAFIQNVHNFRDECLRDERPPVEHVALFDEAQRAWNQEQTTSFMLRKKKRANFTMSEPEFLISCMDRHQDWAVIVCLVGGGQEINTGEAGIGEWIRAVRKEFSQWHVHVSPTLNDSEYEAGQALLMLSDHRYVHVNENLHLSVSMRSFRAENVSAFVKAVLDTETDRARELLTAVSERYPIVLTRDLKAAKNWLRLKARGSERYGLVVSSQALRLKPHAIDVRATVNPIHWFLHPREDVRSSYYLEDAATEFQVQGLEIDWACVVWDGDFRHSLAGWDHWSFRGDRWQRIRSVERQAYLKNAYRVMLTRARQGMVIVVPAGDGEDPTRSAEYYDNTFEYLRNLGMPMLP